MNHFTIKDIENLTGIKSHTLRIWEQRYGIPHPKRTATNIRYYDDDDLKLLLNVSMLNKQGHKISKITRLPREEMEKLVYSSTSGQPGTGIQLDALLASMFNLDEQAFERILSGSLLKSGLERTMMDLFFPFLQRIGILWQTGQVDPSFEHFISNLIRQKIIVAIDAVAVPLAKQSKRFILFLPENETHELGLLFASYIIRSRGHRCIYLGQNLPYKHVDSVTGKLSGDYIMSVLTSAPVKMKPQEFVNKLAARYPKHTLLLTGIQLTSDASIVTPRNVRIMQTFDQFINFMDKL